MTPENRALILEAIAEAIAELDDKLGDAWRSLDYDDEARDEMQRKVEAFERLQRKVWKGEEL